MSEQSPTPATVTGQRVLKAVCAGLRRGAADPLVMVWYPIKDDGSLDIPNGFIFAHKGKKTTLNNAYIGDIYQITDDGDGVCRTSSRDRVGRYENREVIALWKLDQQSAEVSLGMDKQGKNVTFGNMTLDQVRENYSRTVGRTRKAALLASVIQYITG